MAKFEKKRVIVRLLPGLVITFFDKETIYVFPRGQKNGTIFHRWVAPINTYTHCWEPFKRKLLRYKNLSLAKCHELAICHDVNFVGTDRKVKLNKKVVEYRKE